MFAGPMNQLYTDNVSLSMHAKGSSLLPSTFF